MTLTDVQQVRLIELALTGTDADIVAAISQALQENRRYIQCSGRYPNEPPCYASCYGGSGYKSRCLLFDCRDLIHEFGLLIR